MILEIKKYPDQILRKKSKEVKEITPEIRRLIEDMKETMLKVHGAGLAAPQVGVSKRIIVVGTKEGPLALINPKILRKSRDSELGEEGCLSLPGPYLEIKRQKLVEVEALDIAGRKIRLGQDELISKSPANAGYLEGAMLSRIIQHEIDHLNGILIINRISFWQRLKLRKKLKQRAYCSQ
jgi:peptide deformylase